MNEQLQNPMFFYAIAFGIFLALVYVYGRKPMLNWIDGEIAKIRVELDQARELHAEAESTLADCKAKQARAEAEAEAILSRAHQQAAEMRKKTEADIAAFITRHEQLASERIRMVEAEAVADVRAAAIDLAMAMARKTLTENLPEAEAAKLISHAISDIPALKATKAKAA